MYELKDDQIRDLLFHLFRDQKVPVTLLNGGWLLQLMVDNGLAKAHLPYKISVPTALCTKPYFHVMQSMSREAQGKKLNIVQTVLNRTISFMEAYLSGKLWMSSRITDILGYFEL